MKTARKALADAGKSALQIKRKAPAQNKSKKFKIIQRQSQRNLTGKSSHKQAVTGLTASGILRT
jgi:ribosomal protein L21